MGTQYSYVNGEKGIIECQVKLTYELCWPMQASYALNCCTFIIDPVFYLYIFILVVWLYV